MTKHKEILVIASKTKGVVAAAGCMSSAALVQALSDRMRELLADAIARAKSNGRTTVRPCDL